MLATHICIAVGPWELRWSFALDEPAREGRSANDAGDDGAEHGRRLERPYEMRPVELLGPARTRTGQAGVVDGQRNGFQDRG